MAAAFLRPPHTRAHAGAAARPPVRAHTLLRGGVGEAVILPLAHVSLPPTLLLPLSPSSLRQSRALCARRHALSYTLATRALPTCALIYVGNTRCTRCWYVRTLRMQTCSELSFAIFM